MRTAAFRLPRATAWRGPMREMRRTSSSWRWPPHNMRNHLIADDLEPGQRPAIITRNPRIDAREPPAVGDRDAGQDRRMGDDQALRAVSGEHGGELLIDRRARTWRERPLGLGVGVAADEAAVPERAERVVDDRLRAVVGGRHGRSDAAVDVVERERRNFG